MTRKPTKKQRKKERREAARHQMGIEEYRAHKAAPKRRKRKDMDVAAGWAAWRSEVDQ